MGVRVAEGRIALRRGVFETNSSSMHSMAVLKEASAAMPAAGDWREVPAEEGGYWIHVGSNDYGRAPLELLSHPVDKFLYLLASGFPGCCDGFQDREQFISAMASQLDGCRGFVFKGRRWDGSTDYGYVDHQSDGIVWHCIKAKGEDPFDFIFDERKIIIIDGDEYGAWKEMKRSGLIDADNIEFDLLENESGE